MITWTTCSSSISDILLGEELWESPVQWDLRPLPPDDELSQSQMLQSILTETRSTRLEGTWDEYCRSIISMPLEIVMSWQEIRALAPCGAALDRMAIAQEAQYCLRSKLRIAVGSCPMCPESCTLFVQLWPSNASKLRGWNDRTAHFAWQLLSKASEPAGGKELSEIVRGQLLVERTTSGNSRRWVVGLGAASKLTLGQGLDEFLFATLHVLNIWDVLLCCTGVLTNEDTEIRCAK